MKTVIIGVGNPLLSDDSVGVVVSRKISERLAAAKSFSGLSGSGDRKPNGTDASDIDVKEVYAGGIRLMDAMTGYDRAWIIDAMVTGRHEPGTFLSLSAQDVCPTRNLACTHDTNLNTALELGRMLSVRLPSEVRIWGVEAGDVDSFSEMLTDAVARAVPLLVDEIIQELGSCPAGKRV